MRKAALPAGAHHALPSMLIHSPDLKLLQVTAGGWQAFSSEESLMFCTKGHSLLFKPTSINQVKLIVLLLSTFRHPQFSSHPLLATTRVPAVFLHS